MAFFLWGEEQDDEEEEEVELEKNVFSANDNDMNLFRLGLMALVDGWMDGWMDGDRKIDR